MLCDLKPHEHTLNVQVCTKRDIVFTMYDIYIAAGRIYAVRAGYAVQKQCWLHHPRAVT